MANAIDTFHVSEGMVAPLVDATDWTKSPLGNPKNWPHSLRAVTSLVLNSRFPMFVAWGPELGFIYNDAYAEILEDKHPWAFGRPFKVVWAEIWPDIGPIVAKALAGEATYHENLPLTLHRKGYREQTWFTFSYSPVHDESGKVAGMYCACTETTQQVIAGQRHLDEVERFRNLFQQAPGIMAVLRHQNHVFELANQAYCSLVGHRDLVGKPVREAIPEVEGQGLLELLDHVYATGEAYVGRAQPMKLQRHPGEDLEERYVDFVYQPIRDEAGRVTGIFIEGSDVTEAVLTTQALKESEEQLRQLANTIPHLAWMADEYGWIHWYNDRFYDYTGLTFQDTQGMGWQKVHHPDVLPTVKKEFYAALAKGAPFEMTFPVRSASGEYRTFYTKAAPLRDSSGKIVKWFGTNTDIHEIQKAQEELEYTNRRKDEFLAMLAHELRNPLAPISTAAELLRMGHLGPSRVNEACKVISRQAAHMTELIDDLLDVSRVKRGLVTIENQSVNIREVVSDAIDQVAQLMKAKYQKLLVEAVVEDIFVRGDRTRLVQILSNILNNAMRYTPEKGRIRLSLKASDTQIEIAVQDDGVGIDPKLLPRVFDLFTQAERSPDRSQGGLGLGLALVKSLVELHGGKIRVHSEGLNRGSTFVIHLPRELEANLKPARIRQGSSQQEAASSCNRRVMIVDDNVDAAQTLAMLLESQGYDTESEYSATEAIERVSEYCPEVIILDIGLPQMDGYELARHLQTVPEAASAEFIALTGYGQSKDREESKAAGFSHHLVKPVDIGQLLMALESTASNGRDGFA